MKVYTCFPEGKAKALTMSYDDGKIQDERLIQIFDKYGIKATFNLNSGQFSKKEGEGRLTKNQVLSLYKNKNFEVALHGSQHLDLTSVCLSSATKDVIDDKSKLESLFGKVIYGMAYAYGTYNENVISVLKNCGVKYCRTVESTKSFGIPFNFLTWHPTCHHNDENLFDLLNEFLNEKQETHRSFYQPKLFYLWGHSYEFKDDNNWDRIEKFAELVGGNSSIWYATNTEIYNYISAFKSLEFSCENTLVYNPTCTDVYLQLNVKKILEKVVKTTKIY
jgi:hypothetical protein